MTLMHRRLFIAVFCVSTLTFAAHAQEGPKNSVVLVIRHAEDADSGDGISPLCETRAEAYKNYFLNFTIDSKRLESKAGFAAKDSKKSYQPRLSLETMAKATKKRMDTRSKKNQSTDLPTNLRASRQGKLIRGCCGAPCIAAV